MTLDALTSEQRQKVLQQSNTDSFKAELGSIGLQFVDIICDMADDRSMVEPNDSRRVPHYRKFTVKAASFFQFCLEQRALIGLDRESCHRVATRDMEDAIGGALFLLAQSTQHFGPEGQGAFVESADRILSEFTTKFLHERPSTEINNIRRLPPSSSLPSQER